MREKEANYYKVIRSFYGARGILPGFELSVIALIRKKSW